ncbi:MAG: ATP-binding cassette domain-containing protein [Clostridia bacterium]|nr:ATP-binding cassette domain-containing protein [Clostridia bacterium]
MLELKGITKIYPAAGEDVNALRGIDLCFRKSEFVSILGPSGCGKTTMLNIIGGLDQYTSGDLVINGRTTKKFKDRDWDSYRNHSVGFVFQTYNLIPHQSVLRNVELALTLSGVPKKERRERAKKALDMVGLSDQIKKRPAEMSGGQMQRVAIARAIVNDPDIVLADEPTGALDTGTSTQVMDILREIAKDRLVIVVTHNPDLAEKYSTRIVRMLDGRITSDSMPMTDEEKELERQSAAQSAEKGKTRKEKKPSMSVWTSFGLSLNNLFTKKGRTVLTSFAGSIGIIGIALIYAVSHGTTAFIDSVQEDTLSSYPLAIESQHMDMGTLLTVFMGNANSSGEHDDDAVYQATMIYDMVNALSSVDIQKNDLRSFKKYLEKERADEESPLHTALSAIQYSYGLDLQVYTENVDGDIIRSDAQALMSEIMAKYMNLNLEMSSLYSLGGTNSGSSSLMSSSNLWAELIPGNNGTPVNPILEKQYDLVYGAWPARYDEIILFIDENNELNDMMLYALGLKSADEIEAVVKAAMTREPIEYEQKSWSYEEICDMDFRVILASDCWRYDEMTGEYKDLRATGAGLKYLYDNALTLHVVGVAKESPNAISTSAGGAIGYTNRLTEYVIEKAYDSEIVQAQLADPDTDIFTGLKFADDGTMTDAEKAAAFRDYAASLDSEERADAYVRLMSVPPEEWVSAAVEQYFGIMSREDIEKAVMLFMQTETGIDASTVAAYLSSMSDDDLKQFIAASAEEQIRNQYADQIKARLESMTIPQRAAAFDAAVAEMDDARCAIMYDEVIEFSPSTYEKNLVRLGCKDLDTPSAILLYSSSFASKDTVEDEISQYNDGVDELQQIRYTDYVGIMMSSITTIINAITYVLIAFVAVSLIVSSIMIGVITLISVQERTKEIGILRAIGASKANVSSMFNAETVIIGFASGTIGVLVTYLFCLPINILLHSLTDLDNLSASLPIPAALVLTAISVMLTLISGVIPSRSAAKKDPVVALRTE